jgi:glycosyltransferase involved in cell wall biosynthesis
MSGGTDIRILMTTDTVGGVWTYSCALASALAASGAHIYLVTIGPLARADQSAMLRSDRILLIETDLALEWQDPEGQDLANAERILARLEARYTPDIVHLNSFREATFGWRSPVLVVAHSCAKSWAVACNDTAWLNEPRWQQYTSRVAAGLDAAQAWVCPSHAFQEVISEMYRPRSAGAVIQNGIAPQRLHDPKQGFILAAGRLWDRAKNIDALTKAASGLDWPVLVAGPGEPDAPSAVTWLGNLPHAVLRSRLQRAAIYASPALYEPFGLSVLEAAMAGCALVLSDIPTFRELWNGAALFVDPTDSGSLRGALAQLCADRGKRLRLQYAAYARALHFSLERMTKSYLELYQRLLTPEDHPVSSHKIEVHA